MGKGSNPIPFILIIDSQSIISKNFQVTLKISLSRNFGSTAKSTVYSNEVNNKIMTLKQLERKIFSLNQILLMEDNEQY